MHRFLIILTTAALAATATCALAADAPSQSRGRYLNKPPFGSIARQKLLKFRLRMRSNGSLVASLDHNRDAWKNLSPDQREQYRRKAYAFLKKNPAQQEKMLRDYEKFIKLSVGERKAYRRRAAWLKVVVQTFSRNERMKLREMNPEGRARKLIERRDKLIREGKLTLPPASQPASIPGS